MSEVHGRDAVLGGVLTAVTGIGPVMLNYIYDATGSYVPGVLGFIPICLIGSGLFFTLGKYPTFDRAEPKRDAAARPGSDADALSVQY